MSVTVCGPEFDGHRLLSVCVGDGVWGVQPPEPGPEPITAREAGLWDGALDTVKMAAETERSLTAEPSTVLNKLNLSLKPQQSTISESK